MVLSGIFSGFRRSRREKGLTSKYKFLLCSVAASMHCKPRHLVRRLRFADLPAAAIFHCLNISLQQMQAAV